MILMGFMPRNEVNDPLDRVNDNLENDDWMRFFFDDYSGDEEFDGFHNEWVFRDFDSRQPRAYTEHGGPTELHPEEAQPHHYFSMLWGEELWAHLVTETNRYAAQERERNPPPPLRSNDR